MQHKGQRPIQRTRSAWRRRQTCARVQCSVSVICALASVCFRPDRLFCMRRFFYRSPGSRRGVLRLFPLPPRLADKSLNRRIGGQRTEPVVRRQLGSQGPLPQQPLLGFRRHSLFVTTGRLHAHRTELSSSLRTVSVAPSDVRECIPRLTEHKLGHADRTVRSVVIHRACRFPFPSQSAIPVPFLVARPTWSASPPRCRDALAH